MFLQPMECGVVVTCSVFFVVSLLLCCVVSTLRQWNDFLSVSGFGGKRQTRYAVSFSNAHPDRRLVTRFVHDDSPQFEPNLNSKTSEAHENNANKSRQYFYTFCRKTRSILFIIRMAPSLALGSLLEPQQLACTGSQVQSHNRETKLAQGQGSLGAFPE